MEKVLKLLQLSALNVPLNLGLSAKLDIKIKLNLKFIRYANVEMVHELHLNSLITY